LLTLVNFNITVMWFKILLQLLFAFKFYLDEKKKFRMWLLPQELLSALNADRKRDIDRLFALDCIYESF
jgi:hypothetical protein